ncbi:MAG TPA: LUD domain-containing protein [Streptosporangiaceae bacterium]|nr:LUD domain-containing protein [Streptosporangiaceae bacterium]
MSAAVAPGSGSRERMLRGIRAAIGAGDGPGAAPISTAERERRADAGYAALARDYLTAHHDPASHDMVGLFADRAADYRAVVQRVPAAELPAAIARVLGERAAGFGAALSAGPSAGSPATPPGTGTAGTGTAGTGSAGTGAAQFLVPPGFPAEWLAACQPAQGQPVGTGFALLSDDPPLATAALDAAAGVLTGCAAAIAETGTIILDHGAGQGRRALTLVPDFHLVIVTPDKVAADLVDAFARLDPARPHTMVSGPSATSDIELVRVEGVHGPRILHVLIAG